MASAGSLHVNIGARTAGLTRGLRRAQRSVQRTARRMQAAGRKMTAAITLPLAAAGGAAVKVAGDFEESFSRMRGLVGVTAEETARFREEIRALSGETARSPRELAEAMFFVTSAGLEGQNALDALEASAKAAAAGLGDTKTVADAATSAMNAYGAETLSAEEATDVLVATVREGKVQADELAGSMGRIIPTAAQLGIAFNDVGAAIAAMTRVGANSARATTALNRLLNIMNKTTDESREKFEQLGLPLEKLQQIMQEEGLVQGLLAIKDAARENNVNIGELIPRLRALRAVLQIVGKNADEATEIFNSMKDTTGATADAFQEARSTFNFQFQQFTTAAENLGILLGNKLIPPLTNLLEKGQELVRRFGRMSDKMQANVIAAGALAAALGPVLLVVGKLTGAVVRLGAALLSISWPTAAAIAFAGAAAVVVNKWDELSNFFGQLWGDIKTMFSSGTELIGLMWDRMTLNMTQAFANVAQKVIGLFSKVSNFASTMGVSIADPFAVAFGLMEQEAKSWGRGTEEQLQNVSDRVLIASEMFETSLVNAFGRASLAPERFAISAKDSINDLLSFARTKFANFRDLFMGGVGGGAQEERGAPTAQLESNTEGGVTRPTDDMLAQLNVAEGTFQRLQQQVTQFWKTYSSGGKVAKAVNNVVIGGLRSFATQMGGVISRAKSIGDAFKSMGQKAVQALQGMIAKLTTVAAISGIVAATGLGGVLGIGGGFGSVFGSLLGLQHGGLVKAPTLAMVGEGPGTSASNPEVVAPLDKLESMISGAGGGGTLEARVGLDELIFRLEQRRKHNSA